MKHGALAGGDPLPQGEVETDVPSTLTEVTVKKAGGDASLKSVPVTVICCPPAVGPECVASAVTEGAGTYSKAFDLPPGPACVVTVAPTIRGSPPALAGVTSVIEVGELTVKQPPGLGHCEVTVALPSATDVAPMNSVPVTITVAPPAVGPAGGVTPLTTGGFEW